jgi:hypothetical protein
MEFVGVQREVWSVDQQVRAVHGPCVWVVTGNEAHGDLVGQLLVHPDVDVGVFALEATVIGYAPKRASRVGLTVVRCHVAASFDRQEASVTKDLFTSPR